MKNIRISDAQLERIDRQIAELSALREEINKKDRSSSDFLLKELKNCQFLAYGLAIKVLPSPVMKNILPHCGSQDSFEFPLSDGYYLHCSDYGVMLMRDEKGENRTDRFGFLCSHGVAKNSISYYNEGYGSVKSCEYLLERAIRERDEVLTDIEKSFT